MKIKELKDIFTKELQNLYSKEEAETILNYILIDAIGIPKLSIISQPQLELDTNQHEKIVTLLKELKKAVPIQYLLGESHFYGMILNVTSDVLIPRQETEELVNWIIQENEGAKLRILDVCTGSGCIALALKKHLPQSTITAIDISEKALEVAKGNAHKLKLDVEFKKVDALNIEQELKDEQYDIIVSNPPYIRESEKVHVQKSVLIYEPQMALFVSDERPLVFYEAIARYAKHLKPVTLYFEINEDLGNELTEILNSLGFTEITLKADLNGKNRMLKCRNH